MQPDSFSRVNARIRLNSRSIIHCVIKLLIIPSLLFLLQFMFDLRSIIRSRLITEIVGTRLLNDEEEMNLLCIPADASGSFRFHGANPSCTRGTRNPSRVLLLDLEIKKREVCFEKDTADEQRVMVNPFPLSRQKVIFMRRIFVSLTDASLTGEFTTDLQSLNFDPRG